MRPVPDRGPPVGATCAADGVDCVTAGMDELSNRAIGRRIAALRVERGWSQEWLASQVGMTQSVLSRIEAGKREARAIELERLARALGVGPDDLLAGAGEASVSAALPWAAVPAAGPLDEVARATVEPRLSPVEALLCPEAGEGEGRGLPRFGRASFSDMGSRPAPAADVRGRPTLSAGTRSRPSPLGGPPGAPTVFTDVVRDYFRLRALTAESERWRPVPWETTVDSLGRRRPSAGPSTAVGGRVGAAAARNQPPDRYARLWRHELGIGVDGPVPDLVALFEDSGIAEVVVARLEGDRPVCATLSVPGTGPSGMSVGSPESAVGGRDLGLDASQRAGGTGMVDFIFVNAARPVILQRYALAHAFAHLVLGHGDVVDARIEWSRATPPEAEANDFAEEFLAPVNAVSRWYDRHGDPQPSVDVLLDLADAFGITAWAALYRSRAAGRLGRKPQAILTRELRRRQWTLLPEQSFRGGLRDTLSTLSEEAPLPLPGAVGIGGVPAPVTREGGATPVPGEPAAPAVLRVPARMRFWALQALRGGRLSLERAAAALHQTAAALEADLERLGVG